MDAAIGRLLNELEQLNLRKNTLIIFASDNGAAIQAPIKILNCNAGFKGRKGTLYEGGIRVPFIVNQPGMVPIQTLDNLIYFPDMMPTLAALDLKETKTFSLKQIKRYKLSYRFSMESKLIQTTAYYIGNFQGNNVQPEKEIGSV